MAVKTKDYYETLGVGRSVPANEIKTAYRKLARKFHPDLNPGDRAAEERFKELQEAYDVLSNDENRKLYDQYGENWKAVKQGGGPPPPAGEGARAARGPTPDGVNYENFDFGSFSGAGGFDIFEDMFSGARGPGSARAGRGRRSTRGQDVEAELELSLEEAHQGGRRTLQMQVAEVCPTCNGTGVVNENKTCPTCGGLGQVLKPKTLEVKIPAGVRDGSTVRLPGQGGAGLNGSQPGDLYLHIRLRPHGKFTARGDDVDVELAVSPWEAVLGTRVEVPTIDGQVEMTIPAGAQNGQRLRLKGQGLSKRRGGRGDEFVRLKVVAPKAPSQEERSLYEELRDVSNFDPRASRDK
jgi:DnaJ-class molecular chaperone